MLLEDFGRAPSNPTLHEKLSDLFYGLSKSGEYKVRYALEEKIQGLEVIPVGDKQQALTVCGEGQEIRVLVGKRGGFFERHRLPGEWRSSSSGGVAGATDEPPSCRILALSSAYLNSAKGWEDKGSTLHLTSALLLTRGLDRPLGTPQFSRSGDVIVFAVAEGTDSGIWKLEPHSEPVKIRGGYFALPVMTPDGKWLVAVKASNDNQGKELWVRYNTKTGQEYPVDLPQNMRDCQAVFVADRGKVLFTTSDALDEFMNSGPSPGYLLDPETGQVQPVKGEFRPLFGHIKGDLPPAGKPHEFWAAVLDRKKNSTAIGRYNTSSFLFKPLLQLPGIRLTNDDIWVNAQDNKLWFTDLGYLLRMPLP